MVVWIENRINLARKLHDGECGGGYSDAVIILVSVVSGIASRTWPGKNKDRKRFVETLVRFCPSDLNLSQISIPLLIQNLNEENNSSATQLRSSFNLYGSDCVITGREIDKSEIDVLTVAPNLSVKKVRDYSYANLLYQEMRSGLVHEYRPTDKASTYPMSDSGEDVSYVNVANLESMEIYRQIYFEYDWLEKVLDALHNSISSIWQKNPLSDPENWWIEGG
jgi:hypothetical protein